MSTWVFLLKGLSFLARLGAFAASVIVAGLLAALLVEKPTWISHLVIYIECIAGISIITSLIPPYPNFIYDGFFAVCWLLSAGFSLLVMVSVKCYLLCKGIRVKNEPQSSSSQTAMELSSAATAVPKPCLVPNTRLL